jgi:hypothetical protein
MDTHCLGAFRHFPHAILLQFVELLRFIYTSLASLMGDSSRTGKFSEKLTELN